MGLQSQLNDVSSDSIPLLLLALAATCVAHLRSSLSCLLHSLGLPRPLDAPDLDPHPAAPDDDGGDGDARFLSAPLGSGLAGLIVLAEQLNLNRLLSDRFSVEEGGGGGGGVGGGTCSECCMVCLCGLGEGDRVRRLPCRHVFHKRCFDGWLDQLKFDCPVCRSKLVPDERVELTARRVGGDVAAFFSPR